MATLDNFLFIGLPYMALVIFLVGTIYRYRVTRFSYSSMSSQFLEGRQLFWGILPFHWGLLFLFLGHLAAFLLPGTVLAFNREPLRLLLLEISGFGFGIIVLYGLILLFLRRRRNERIRMVTTRMDLVVELLLIIQVFLGLWVALTLRWGSGWFAAVLTPYLRSIFIFQPDIDAVAALPWVIKSHLVGAYLIFMLIPFTRLVHLLVVPLQYIWRPYQRVIWNWPRKRVRRPESGWTVHPPRNN